MEDGSQVRRSRRNRVNNDAENANGAAPAARRQRGSARRQRGGAGGRRNRGQREREQLNAEPELQEQPPPPAPQRPGSAQSHYSDDQAPTKTETSGLYQLSRTPPPINGNPNGMQVPGPPDGWWDHNTIQSAPLLAKHNLPANTRTAMAALKDLPKVVANQDPNAGIRLKNSIPRKGHVRYKERKSVRPSTQAVDQHNHNVSNTYGHTSTTKEWTLTPEDREYSNGQATVIKVQDMTTQWDNGVGMSSIHGQPPVTLNGIARTSSINPVVRSSLTSNNIGEPLGPHTGSIERTHMNHTFSYDLPTNAHFQQSKIRATTVDVSNQLRQPLPLHRGYPPGQQ